MDVDATLQRARALTELGNLALAGGFQSAARTAYLEANELGFRGHATVAQPYRGKGAAVPLLLLVSARGNIHTQLWINDRQFAITAVYADFYPAVTALPPHGTTGAPPSTRCSAPRSGCCTGSANPPDWRRTLSMSS